MIRNRCIIFGVDGGSHTKNGWKIYATYASLMMQFSSFFGVDTSISPKNITMIT